MSMNKTIGIAVGVVVIIVVGYFVFSRNSGLADSTPTATTPAVTESALPSESVAANPSQGPTENNIKTFTVIGRNFSFSPSEIRVNKGDTVKIVFQNQDGMHDWVLDEFNVRTPRIQTGQSAEVTFVADKAGTFEYYCSVGEHRAMGMHGNIIVQ